jgi:hypothetical protein
MLCEKTESTYHYGKPKISCFKLITFELQQVSSKNLHVQKPVVLSFPQMYDTCRLYEIFFGHFLLDLILVLLF